MTQARQTSTKGDIKAALVKLLQEKDFEAITISDITRTADINRSTFYLHYLDKLDMIDKIIADILQEIMSKLPIGQAKEKWLPSVVAVLDLVVADFDFVQSLILSRPDYISNILRSFLLELIDRVPELEQALNHRPALNPEYAREVFINSNIGIILHWIRKGCKESTQEIAQMFFVWNQLPSQIEGAQS
ncbi:TetR/AcrR family transcriptional regulator [Eremococcus coleocola]|uniref:TetR/AcrR family transcriptional regulator n=1 Tax=Eremococcus coleocola TaxID=88132 RepID=UPI0003FCB672|nr:TetR-like C-terminal domain-containing protein [Eremococcus coleocola]